MSRDDELLDKEGNVYEPGLLGGHHQKQGIFGPEKDTGLFGPNVKQGLFGPEPARGAFGGKKTADDGTPLYQRSSAGGSSGGGGFSDEAAGGLVGLAIVIGLAILAAAAWVFAKLIGWWWPRVSASIGRDVEVRRLSWTTLAWMGPLVVVGVFLAGNALFGSHTAASQPAPFGASNPEPLAGGGAVVAPATDTPPPPAPTFSTAPPDLPSIEQAVSSYYDQTLFPSMFKMTSADGVTLLRQGSDTFIACVAYTYAGLGSNPSGRDVRSFTFQNRRGAWPIVASSGNSDFGSLTTCQDSIGGTAFDARGLLAPLPTDAPLSSEGIPSQSTISKLVIAYYHAVLFPQYTMGEITAMRLRSTGPGEVTVCAAYKYGQGANTSASSDRRWFELRRKGSAWAVTTSADGGTDYPSVEACMGVIKGTEVAPGGG